jgi:hypothetical protein
MDSANALNEPKTPTGTSSATAITHSPVATAGEQCPSCAATVAPDQRYCLQCGTRCGEPRLPFMNAATFMDSMKKPAATAPGTPPSRKRRRASPNAALIAGVGTLLLALGIGVLIGRSGDHSAAPTAAAPQVITVHSGGEAESANAASGEAKASSGGAKNTKAAKANAASAKKKAATGQGAEEVLKPSAGVKLPPANVQVGGKCESGAAGCEGGEFTGNYFGGE